MGEIRCYITTILKRTYLFPKYMPLKWNFIKRRAGKRSYVSWRCRSTETSQKRLTFVFFWFVRTLFYRHAVDTSPCPGSATTPATADSSYITTLPDSRKIRCIRRRRSVRNLSNKESGTNFLLSLYLSG